MRPSPCFSFLVQILHNVRNAIIGSRSSGYRQCGKLDSGGSIESSTVVMRMVRRPLCHSPQYRRHVASIIVITLTSLPSDLSHSTKTRVVAQSTGAASADGKLIFDAYTKTANAATILFPLWTVLFTAIALKRPSTFDFFTTEYFTAALAALMLSMGITLTPADFAAAASEPSSILMQFSLCYGMMPILALVLGRAFGLDAGLLAGMVLVGSINGGQASNLCTYIAKGNVALSVLMTTATTVGAILMTPFLCKLMIGAVVPVDAKGIATSTCQVSSLQRLYVLVR